MRLPTPFIKLPVAFDAKLLAAEVRQFHESEWRPHPQAYPGNSALILISHGGVDNDDSFGPMAATPRLGVCPYLMQVLAGFNTVIGRSRLMRLTPGAEVKPHSDIAYYWHNHIRIHVPIVTEPDVRFVCDGVEVHMAAGEAWVFDNWRPHYVLNHTHTTRIHLVVDTVGSGPFWQMVSQGTAIPRRDGSKPEQIRVSANGSTRQAPLVIEQHNQDEIAHPDTVRAIVQDLLNDLRQPGAVPEHDGRIEFLLTCFASDWRAAWASHGNRPEGHAAYHELVQYTLQQVSQGFPTIRLRSNGLPLIQILRNYLPAMFVPHAKTLQALKVPRFDRPIIIVATPRSGSTLLFETLSRHPDIWTLGNESHGEIENIPGLAPADRGYISNTLGTVDAAIPVAETVQRVFAERLRNSKDQLYAFLPASGQRDNVRFLEKTPKNALRIPFLNTIFPDAFFIYLHRDPKPNLASMIEAWQSGKFVTYRDLPGWQGLPWSLLLTPGWQKLRPDDLASVVAHQWCTANTAILDSLETLPVKRWCSISHEDFTASPATMIKKLCVFCELDPAALSDELQNTGLPLSRYTLTPPSADKWLRHAKDIERVMSTVEPVASRIQTVGNRL
ncbi:MAG: sulfotransferase [Gammaproteobacteria bacterium]